MEGWGPTPPQPRLTTTGYIMQGLLNWLPLLACPLIMLVCMRGMSSSKGDSSSGDASQLSQDQVQQRLDALMREELVLREALAARDPQGVETAAGPHRSS